jgi:ABC-type cobalamin/Fe3+-siderophores transport system ATPase subunit
LSANLHAHHATAEERVRRIKPSDDRHRRRVDWPASAAARPRRLPLEAIQKVLAPHDGGCGAKYLAPVTSADETASDPARPGIRISTITLADDKVIPIPGGGVTAIVGGNNTGKSTLLTQINQWLINVQRYTMPLGQYEMLKQLTVEKTGSAQGFAKWIEENSSYQQPTPSNPGQTEGFVRAGCSPITLAHAAYSWEQLDSGHFGQLAAFLAYYAGAGGRSATNFSMARRQRPGDPPSHVLHYLEDDNQLRLKIDQLYEDIFGERLTLDKLGQSVSLRVGKPPASLDKLGYYSDVDEIAARDDLDKLPPLDSQGDGMKALLGLLLPIATAAYPIIIVDEPEAFLHPPQATKLGRILGDLARETGVQVILATHDRNILIGLLESKAPLSVVRLTRQGNVTKSYRLEPEKINSIWSDPVLRYSHVLDGLFHRLVIMAENERDCTFYAAALDAAHEESPLPVPPSEVLFVPTAGKDGQTPVVAALAELKVPVVACTDIDILDDKTKIKRLVEALGGRWMDFDAEYSACTQDFRQPREPVLVAQVGASVKEFLDKILREDPTRKWDSELKDDFRALTRAGESRWVRLKEYGVHAFPKHLGARPVKLLDQFDSIGLVIVRVGDLESFGAGFDGMPRKGLGWLRAALEAGVHKSPAAFEHARRLVSVIPKVIDSGQGT